MMNQTMKTIPANDPVRAHRSAVEAYQDIAHVATSCYPELTDAAREAYEILPMLIDDCQRTFEAIPPDLRPLHYLSVRR